MLLMSTPQLRHAGKKATKHLGLRLNCLKSVGTGITTTRKLGSRIQSITGACTENCEISQIEKIRGSNRSISATSSLNDSKGDSAKMWKSLKQVIPDSKSPVQALKVKHKVFTKPSEIVEISNKHFSTIGQKLGQCFGRNVDVDRFPLKTETNFSLNPVSENFVRDQLRQLKPNKAVDLDKVSSRLLFKRQCRCYRPSPHEHNKLFIQK